MAADGHLGGPGAGRSDETAIAQAIQKVTASTQALVRDEIELAKLEVQQKLVSFGRGAAIGLAAGFFLLGAGFVLLHGVAWLLWYLIFPDGQFFWGFFLEALILVVFAATAGLAAAKLVGKAKAPVPEQAIAAARDTREAIRQETSLAREQVREVIVKPEEQR